MVILTSEGNMKTYAKCHFMMKSLYFKIVKRKKKTMPESLVFKLCYIHPKCQNDFLSLRNLLKYGYYLFNSLKKNKSMSSTNKYL